MAWDVFLCHNRADKPAVTRIAEKLRAKGVQCWLDTWNLLPGDRLIPAIEAALRECASVAVFLGPSGQSPWQNNEIEAALNAPGRRVIPVLLPGVEPDPNPSLLQSYAWVELPSLEDSQALERFIRGIRGQQPPPSEEPRAAFTSLVPYRGLDFFDVAHGDIYAGRETEAATAAEAIRARSTPRFLAIVGVSGSGKSSLARAGVLARLGDIPHAIVVPGAHPLEQLAAKMSRALNREAGGAAIREQIAAYRAEERTLHRDGNGFDGGFTLLVDQFEQVFSSCEDAAEREAFINNLVCAAREPDGRTTVLVTLRADFYPECAGVPGLRELMAARQTILGPMTREQLRSAIEDPARKAGLIIDPALTHALIDDCGSASNPLPLLQFVLLKLWTQSGSSGRLTLGDYEGIGTFSGALNKHAENVYQQHLSETQRPLAQSVFIRLVQPFQTTRFAKQTQGFEELYPAEAASEQKKQIQEVIGILAGHDARLLTIGRAMGQDQTSRPIVDLAHEILISCWDRYERWLNEKREFLLWKERLRVSLTDWRDSGRAGGTYLSGILLNQARNWLRVHPAEHSPEERQFINTSRRRRALRVAALAGVLLAVVSAAAYWNNRIATREKLLNNARILIRQGNPLALVVALHAAETYDRTALLQQAYQAAANPLYPYLNGRPVADLQFSSSDDKIAIALGGDTGEVRLCDTRGNCETFKAPGERVTCVAFGGASGEALLAGSEDGTVTIWQGGSVTRYEAGGRVNALGWAPDSGAVAGVGDELVVFRPQRTTIADFTDAVRDLAVSPDGARIAVAGADEKLRIWRKTGVQEHDNGAPMRQVMFSSDGATLATVDMLGAAYVWDLNNMSRRAFRRTASVPVTGGSLSADGKVLATLNADHSISAWDVATGRETQYYADQNEEIERISLNSDGSRLAAGRDDGNVQLYELNFDRLRARTRDRLRTVYDADGCRLYLSVSDCERYAPQ